MLKLSYFAAALIILCHPTQLFAQDQCPVVDSSPYQSACGTVTIADSIHPGETFIVTAVINTGGLCGNGALLSVSNATSSVIVNGVAVTATSGTGTIYHSQVQPISSMKVSLSGPGPHTVSFTIDPKAKAACVLNDGQGNFVGPWAVLSGGNWSAPRPFGIIDYPIVRPGAVIEDPPIVSVNGKNVSVVLEKFSGASLKKAKAILRSIATAKSSGGKLGLSYQVYTKRVSDTAGNPVKTQIKKTNSKKNTLVIKNLSPGNYEMNYKVMITRKKDDKISIVGSTKLSPIATFAITE